MDRQRASCIVDSGMFFLFHPRDFDDDEAAALEPPDRALREGLVVGLHVLADGERAVDVCLGPAPPEARGGRHFVFPLHVRHGALHATDRMARVDEHDWEREPRVVIPKGRYRATWYVEHGVLELCAVASFDGLLPWPDLPSEEGEHPRPPAPAPPGPVRRVRHPKFGEGVVLAQEPGSPPRLHVRFADAERRLLATFVTPVPELPHAEALAASIRAGTPRRDDWLADLVTQPMPDDLRTVLEAWSSYLPVGRITIGDFVLGPRPTRMSAIPLSFRRVHGELEVADTFPGLALGTILLDEDDERLVFIARWSREHAPVQAAPRLADGDGVRDGVVLAPSLEELLRHVHRRARPEDSALTTFLSPRSRR